MGWDEQRNATAVQRTKEEAQDYRYFPEPDLPPLLVSRDWVEEIRSRLPELPDAKRDRFITQHRLSAYDAGVLVADMSVADYFEAAVCSYSGEPKTISNWASGELFRLMKESGVPMDAIRVSPTELAELATLVDQGTINYGTAKDVLGEMFSHGGSAAEIVRLRGLSQISDQGALQSAVAQVLAENPEQVRQYMAGKETIIQWLMGQVMRATQGKANPQVVIDVLREQLGSTE
jgi:aspartyl-tRNA(Asn)/glutamyl-tRNA(Gln) amidotransferase subunit B